MKTNKKILDVIILGSGPTGLYGAFYASLKHLDTLILEINSTYGGAPARLYPEKPLYDIPGCTVITGAELVKNMYEQLSNLDHWEIKYNIEVIKIIQHNDNDDLYYELIDKNNCSYYGNNIIFASGYGAFEFITFEETIKITNQPNISYYVNKLNYYKGKDIVICGGGDSAVDIANSLKGISNSTSIIHRRNEFRAKAANVQKLHDHAKLLLNKTIYAIDKQLIHFKDNETNDLDSIRFDELIVLYGTKMIPNNIEIENLYNKIHKIDVDPLTFESLHYKNIFACGLANNQKHEQTIITGISDIIKVIASIAKNKK